MAIIVKDGISGKVCSHCREWKPLHEFPSDPTHGDLQGGRHCRCYLCHQMIRKFGSDYYPKSCNQISEQNVSVHLHDPSEERIIKAGPLAGTKIFIPEKFKQKTESSQKKSSSTPDVEKIYSRYQI